MNSVFLAIFTTLSAFSCPETQLVGWKPSEAMTEMDKSAYSTAQSGCYRYYGERSPCLKKFIKKAENNYHAICGKASK